MEWTAQCSNIGCLVDHTSPAWALLDIRNNAITQMFRDKIFTATEMVWWRSQSRSLWLMLSTNVCKEAIFRFAISSFETQLIRCMRSATILTLSEMRSWWIAWNSEMRWVFFRLLGFWCWSELIWSPRRFGRGGLAGSVMYYKYHQGCGGGVVRSWRFSVTFCKKNL